MGCEYTITENDGWGGREINRDPGLILDIQFPPAYSISPKAEDQSGECKTR